jgi:hypothetical protein
MPVKRLILAMETPGAGLTSEKKAEILKRETLKMVGRLGDRLARRRRDVRALVIERLRRGEGPSEQEIHDALLQPVPEPKAFYNLTDDENLTYLAALAAARTHEAAVARGEHPSRAQIAAALRQPTAPDPSTRVREMCVFFTEDEIEAYVVALAAAKPQKAAIAAVFEWQRQTISTARHEGALAKARARIADDEKLLKAHAAGYFAPRPKGRKKGRKKSYSPLEHDVAIAAEYWARWEAENRRSEANSRYPRPRDAALKAAIARQHGFEISTLEKILKTIRLPCSVPGCEEFIDGRSRSGMCKPHRRQHDREGSTIEPGAQRDKRRRPALRRGGRS